MLSLIGLQELCPGPGIRKCRARGDSGIHDRRVSDPPEGHGRRVHQPRGHPAARLRDRVPGRAVPVLPLVRAPGRGGAGAADLRAETHAAGLLEHPARAAASGSQRIRYDCKQALLLSSISCLRCSGAVHGSGSYRVADIICFLPDAYAYYSAKQACCTWTPPAAPTWAAAARTPATQTAPPRWWRATASWPSPSPR